MDTEIDDAKELVKSAGGDPEQFTFEITRDDIQLGGGAYAVHYKVAITANGVTRTYEGGHGLASWLPQFEAHLKNWGQI